MIGGAGAENGRKRAHDIAETGKPADEARISRGSRRPLAATVLPHMAGAILALLAVVFIRWFLVLNPGLWEVFRHLGDPFVWGQGGFDWAGLAWGAAAVILCCVLGWFLIECFEVYIPRTATLALAFIFGMGIAGVVLEWLAIPFLLRRRTIAGGLALALGLLALGVWRRTRRPPESGLGGEAGTADHLMRREMARAGHEAAIERPRGAARVFCVVAFALIAAITGFNFWHALLYPEVYWDSLILYLGYARMTFLEGGFPIKVVGQVGIGLGANYPHLFAVLGAGVATVAGEWSELPQRLIAPLCGVATTLLVYHTSLRLTRRIDAALAFALLYRSIPLGVAYDQYASDYALAMLFGAAMLYLALRAIETGLLGYLTLGALLIAFSMHLNYLMGILWLPWIVTVVMAQVGWRAETWPPGADPEAPWTARPRRLGIFGLLFGPWLWLTLIAAGAIGSTWYVRNWIVTGNPVYAFFFDSLFPASRNINPEVMAAAAEEWQANGAGIGRLGETVGERLTMLPVYLFGAPGWAHQGSRLMPMAGAFALGGLLVWMARWLASPLAHGRSASERAAVRFGLVVISLAGALLAFHIVLAPFYLYQNIKLLPCLALLAAMAWPVWRHRPWGGVLAVGALAAGVMPGLAVAMMGYNIPSPNLYALHHPLPEAYTFYQWRFGGDADMWRYLNENLPGRRILTHENRHLVLDPSIEIVQLDDWEMQALWQIEDPAERVRRLIEEHRIRYYLYVPNEDATPTNARMGAATWAELGLAELVHETLNEDGRPNRLYRLIAPGERPQQPAPQEEDAAPAEESQAKAEPEAAGPESSGEDAPPPVVDDTPTTATGA